MFDIAVLAPVAAVFFLAGAVKGVIGLGLPTVSLALLTLALDLPTAMALLLVPSFVTNLWQGLVGGHLGPLLRRLWPFLTLAVLTVGLGGGALAAVDLTVLVAVLGGLLIAYGASGLAGWRPSIGPRRERWAGPLIGVVNGTLTGMTGSFVVPGVMYLQALGLPRDALVQAMGILFTLSTAALALSLQGQRLISVEVAGLSALALVPAMAGMGFGQAVRRYLSEAHFRRVFFAALLVLGSYIAVNAILRLA